MYMSNYPYHKGPLFNEHKLNRTYTRVQESFVANILRIVHTMMPVKASKKKKKKKRKPLNRDDVQQMSALQVNKMRFPGLALKDDPQVQDMLKEEVEEAQDSKVADDMMDELASLLKPAAPPQER